MIIICMYLRHNKNTKKFYNMYFYMLNIAEAFQKEIDKIFSQNNIQSFVYYVMYCLQNIKFFEA